MKGKVCSEWGKDVTLRRAAEIGCAENVLRGIHLPKYPKLMRERQEIEKKVR